MGNPASAGAAKRGYHHGDLRAALIREGLRRLATATGDELSLRELARAAGVSATAVYRHFPDKAALMAALAREGHDRLAEAQRQAAAGAAGAGGAMAAFAATGRAYIRFALANPALFRLAFSAAPDGPGGAPHEAMTMLHGHVAATQGLDPWRGSADTRTLRAWALVHGLAMLMLDGQVPADDAIIDAVVDAGVPQG
ncbi:TetR/AcrR family transcriptional regulator [Sphingomonas sp.]|uniref:TetR/AcrR family transcriptional regulator n=1 Tax=Sphingomonas sp. TaxID=28214 RepID=UPI002CEE4F38|nr:TetR/AcrR family transcriptional regulator [Sphingomonas sp.]HWK36697.1 TetR/AcrR family transcriptional regulator [Sphingomonas sp.]